MARWSSKATSSSRSTASLPGFARAPKAHREASNASLALAKSEFARITRLVNSQAASREELETWRAKQGSAIADRQGADAEIQKAQLDLDFCDIRAPITGRIGRTFLAEGNLVNPSGGDSLLTTIVSIDPMFVYFEIDERALLRYRREYAKLEIAGGEDDIKKLKIPFFVAIEGDNDYGMKGTIDFVDNRVSRGTGTLQIRGVINNAGRLLDDGLRARVCSRQRPLQGFADYRPRDLFRSKAQVCLRGEHRQCRGTSRCGTGPPVRRPDVDQVRPDGQGLGHRQRHLARAGGRQGRPQTDPYARHVFYRSGPACGEARAQ